MATDQTALIKLCADAAKTFTGEFYSALNNDRSRIGSFYCPNAGVVWNGNPVSSGEDFAAFYAKMLPTKFDVQSYDAQPMQPDGRGSCSFLLVVSGQVKIGTESATLRGFSDTFVMKPDAKEPTRFLIATQGFRLVV
ncbi:hypothetical protein BDZ91DRAFT_709125 [Kalaharituber pfeilii]|nr:hypothetical protein BDZ91DRAFT_709125 [Kalaharituber pfeilii]